VKQVALELGIPVLHDMPQAFDEADVGVIVAYGKILPAKVLEAMPKGFINLHFSKLPAWRGAAPVQRAIESGDKTTGVTVFRLLEGLDDGPIYTQQEFEIFESETSGELLQRLSVDGIPAVIDALRMVQAGETPRPQLGSSGEDATSVTYASKLLKSEARIDWSKSPEAIAHHINAFSPNPGAYFEVQIGEKPPLRVTALKAKVADTEDDKTQKVCGKACGQVWERFAGVELVEVKPAGKNAMAAKSWLNGLMNTGFTVL
jgi:methionyl-tRNA formyltransferase